MPKEVSQPLAAAEWKVMDIVWRRKTCAARDVCEDARREHGWSASTVKTLLRRLVEKGYLQTRKSETASCMGRPRPALSAPRRAADAQLQNALDGTVGQADLPVVPPGQRLSPKLAEAFMQRTDLNTTVWALVRVIEFLAQKHNLDRQLSSKMPEEFHVGRLQERRPLASAARQERERNVGPNVFAGPPPGFFRVRRPGNRATLA
jgi:predicted transcriptional regulator